MMKYHALFAISLIVLQSWYLAGQSQVRDALSLKRTPIPPPGISMDAAGAAGGRDISPTVTAPEEAGPALSVEIGRELKGVATGPEPADIQELRSAYVTSPELAAGKKATRERLIAEKYGLLFKRLGLSPDQIATVSRLLFNKANLGNDISDVIQASRAPGQKQDLVADTNLVAKLLKFGSEEDAAQLKEALGEDGFTRYLDYEANLPRYATVSALQQELTADPANALSEKQTNDLMELFRNDRTEGVRLLLPVLDNSHAQFEVDGMRFTALEPREVTLVDGYRLESGYIPSRDLLSQAWFLSRPQVEALNAIVKRRTAAHAMADDFWAKPSPAANGGGK